MISIFKFKSREEPTLESAQKVQKKASARISEQKKASGDGLETRNPGEASKLGHASIASIRLPSTVDHAAETQRRAETLNNFLSDPIANSSHKQDKVNGLDKQPDLAMARVGKLTLLEHAFTRLARSQPKVIKGIEQPASDAHHEDFSVAAVMLQKYNSLSERDPRIGSVMGNVAKLSLASGTLGSSFTSGALQIFHSSLGATHRRACINRVKSSLDPVASAEAEIRSDFKAALGSKSTVSKALENPQVHSYFKEAVAELVLASEARKMDVNVPHNLFGRDGQVANFVRTEVQQVWDVHANNHNLRSQAQVGGLSESFKAQEPGLLRMNALLKLFNGRSVPSTGILSSYFREADEMF